MTKERLKPFRVWIDDLLMRLAKNARWDGRPDERVTLPNGTIAVGRGIEIPGARHIVSTWLHELGIDVEPSESS